MMDMEEMEFFNYVFEKIKDSKDIDNALKSLNLGGKMKIEGVTKIMNEKEVITGFTTLRDLKDYFLNKYCVFYNNRTYINIFVNDIIMSDAKGLKFLSFVFERSNGYKQMVAIDEHGGINIKINGEKDVYYIDNFDIQSETIGITKYGGLNE